MKKLITTNLGGHPIKFEDLEFLQEQIRELSIASFGFLDAAKVTLLKGIDLSVSTDGYTVTVTEGYVWYDNEFFHVSAHEAQGSGSEVAKWVVVESWDSRGNKEFYEEGVGYVDVYKIRELKLDFVSTASPGVTLANTQSYLKQKEAWITPSLATFWNDGLSYPGSYPFKYRKNELGQLEIVGAAYVDGNERVGFILPEGYRPNEDIIISVPVYLVQEYTTGNSSALVIIKKNGEFYFNGTMTSAFSINETLILDN